MLYTHLSLFFFSVSFSSVYSACFYFFPSVYLILMKNFYIKEKKTKKMIHSVSSSFDRLFVSKNMNLYEGVGLWTVCVCVCVWSIAVLFLSLQLNRLFPQSASISSINHIFVCFFWILKHTFIHFTDIFLFCWCLVVVLLTLIVVFFVFCLSLCAASVT
jgi:hypothetical protein